MLGIWQKQVNNKVEMTPVIPVILYHGTQKWNRQPLRGYFKKPLDERLLRFLPEFDYILNDLEDYSDKELAAIEERFLYSSMFSFKHYREKKYLYGNFEKLLLIDNEHFQTQIFHFLIEIADIVEEEANKIVNNIKNKALKINIMSTLEQIRRNAREKVLVEERNKSIRSVKNMHEEGIETSKIAQFLELSVDFVQGVIDGKITEEV